MLAVLALLTAFPPAVQTAGTAPAPPPAVLNGPGSNVRWSVAGTVTDLARDDQGRILYCTAEREVGRLAPGAGVTVLGTAASFPNELRAVAASGSTVVTLDFGGDVRTLPNGAPPAAWVYDDEYMILDATDLIVDARGSFLIASATPSSGARAINWIQSNGVDWGYYLVKHQPIALAHDPLTGGILFTDATQGGHLRLVQAGSPIRATSALDTLTLPGVSAAAGDGDLAVAANGDVYWIAGGSVYRHERAGGTTMLLASGLGALRGVVIAPATSYSGHDAPYSLFVAEGAGPTYIRELAPVASAASLVANDQGDPPGRGRPVNLIFGFQAFELAADNQGRLLLGGSSWGNPYYVKRVTLSGTPGITTVATTANGLVGTVEGLAVGADDAIYALARDGRIQRITENPLTVTTVFSDPGAQIGNGKDLVMDIDGSFYVGTSDGWDFGKVLKATAGGSATLLTLTQETRGLAASLYFSQWNNMAFHGTVDELDLGSSTVTSLPGFAGINFANGGLGGSTWGDGDLCVDVEGTIYALSEDDWSLVRYHADLDGCERIGSGYLGHPSGLAIAPSTAAAGSSTGWSLYVAEYTNLYEIPSVPAPAPTLANTVLGVVVRRTLTGAPHPRHGRPSALGTASQAGAPGLVVGTDGAELLALAPTSGTFQPLAGPDQGLRGRILAVAGSTDGLRLLALNDRAEIFELRAGRVRQLAVDPVRCAALVERYRSAPQLATRLVDPWSGASTWYALDGWAVWRVGAAR